MKTIHKNQPTIAAIRAAANPNAPAIAPRDTSSKGTATKAAKTAPKLAEKLAQSTAPQTAATKAKAQAKVEIVVTQPNEVNKRTEAYKLFTEIGKTNEKIYAFFDAHKADLFKTVDSGVQVDAANAYKNALK